MKVLITGGSGRIGRYLLLNKPESADTEVLLSLTDPIIEDIPWYRTDIAEEKKTVIAVTCASPDAVIHLAAYTDVEGCEKYPDLAYKINRDGAYNVAKACSECGAKMIYISTDYVFDGVYGPYSESDRTNPVNIYGHSKLEGEHAVQKLLENAAIIRVSVPFGKRLEGAGHNFISWLIEQLSMGNTIKIADDQFTTPSYMEDLAGIFRKFAENNLRGLFHYGTANRLSRYDMALAVCREMNFSESLLKPVKTSEMNFTAKRPLESGFIINKIHETLNIIPELFNEALVRMI